MFAKSFLYPLLLCAATICSAAQAASGPVIPCDSCDETAHFSAPKSGFWYNPARPGSGISIDIQDGLLLGAVYAYNLDGSAQWHTFHGRLENQGKAPFALGLTAALERFEDGMCLNCPYAFPTYLTDSGQISIEFTQRNYGSYSVQGGEVQFIVPLLAGIEAPHDFGDLVDYGFPVLTGQWAFVIDNPAILGPWGTESVLFNLAEKLLVRDNLGRPYSLNYLIARTQGTVDLNIPGSINCRVGVDLQQNRLRPQCEVSLVWNYFGTGGVHLKFPLPYANIGEDRLEAINKETGIRLQAFRVSYKRGDVESWDTDEELLQ